jgi:hypothetical protein
MICEEVLAVQGGYVLLSLKGQNQFTGVPNLGTHHMVFGYEFLVQ